jgi:hypothetical protein
MSMTWAVRLLGIGLAALVSGSFACSAGSSSASCPSAEVVTSSEGAASSAGPSVTSVAYSSDGTTMAIGAPRPLPAYREAEADAFARNVSAVYVFSRTGSTWAQQAYIEVPEEGERRTYFGYCLALSGDGAILAVGAPHDASGASGVDGNTAGPLGLDSGAAYVFARVTSVRGVSWTRQAFVKARFPSESALFGATVALSDDGATLAVGSRDSSNATGIDGDQTDTSMAVAGAVTVFSRNGSTWIEQAYIKPAVARLFRGFGEHSIALSSDGATLAVGAAGDSSRATGIDGDEGDTSAHWAGAAYVFARTGVRWSQQAYLKASNTRVEAWGAVSFGWSVAVSNDGSIVAVGAPGESSGATGPNADQADDSAPAAGAVYAFSRTASTWAQQAYVKAATPRGDRRPFLAGPHARFGGTVAFSSDGSELAVTASDPSTAWRTDGDAGTTQVANLAAPQTFVRLGPGWAPAPQELLTVLRPVAESCAPAR